MRGLWINVHLYAVAFLVLTLLRFLFSGGLNLVGLKGLVIRTELQTTSDLTIDLSPETLRL